MAEPRLLGAEEPGVSPCDEVESSLRRVGEAELVDERQLRVRERVLSMLRAHGGSLADRANPSGHLTGSALVVDARAERTLVMLHAKLGRWLQPGGHADGDHELAGVALREALEETGIRGLRIRVPAVDIDIHAVDHGDTLGEHLHFDLRFVVVAPPGAVERGNHESRELRWVTMDELEVLADDQSVLRLARRGFAVIRPELRG